jgi:hypothetical protein
MLRRTMLIAIAVCTPVALASCMSAQQTTTPPATVRDDPNFPRPSSDALTGPLKVRWHYVRGTALNIEVIDPRLRSQTGPQAEYLGYDSQRGQSLFTRSETGEVLGFNLKNNSLEVVYKEKGVIPLAVLNNLRGGDIDYLIAAKGGKPRHPEPQPRELTPVELAQRQREQEAASRQGGGVVSQQDAAQAIAMLGISQGTTTSRPAPSGMITGTGADVREGVLLFIRPDKSRASYKVVRPRMTQAASSPTGDITGTWIATEDSGDGIMFMVGPDKSVSGREIPAQALKMLMQPPQ